MSAITFKVMNLEVNVRWLDGSLLQVPILILPSTRVAQLLATLHTMITCSYHSKYRHKQQLKLLLVRRSADTEMQREYTVVEMTEDSLLQQYNLTEQDIVDVIYKMQPINALHGELLPNSNKTSFISYENLTFHQYLKEVTVISNNNFVDINQAINVDVSTPIKVVLKSNLSNLSLYVPGIVDNEALSLEKSNGDMARNLGLAEAKKRGYVKWTNEEYRQRILLLEVTDAVISSDIIETELNSRKYDVNGLNNGYIDGDIHSWQRYTSSLPVECSYNIEDNDIFATIHSDAAVTITMKPYGPLKHNQYYIILFQNNTPIVPVGDRLNNQNSIDYYYSEYSYVNNTIEDKIYIFKTAVNKKKL